MEKVSANQVTELTIISHNEVGVEAGGMLRSTSTAQQPTKKNRDSKGVSV